MSMRRSMIMFRRIVRTGVLNFARNAWLGIAAMAVMVITLTIILFSIIANATFSNTIQAITDKIDISVYLKDSVSAKQQNELVRQVEALENVKSVNVVSKEEALMKYREQNKDNPELLEAISQTDNPLSVSLQIKPKDPNKIEDIRAFLEKKEIKDQQSDETSYSGDRKEAIDKITGPTIFFRKAGVVGVVISAVFPMLIIFNTIQMAIFNRRDELTIMRLLGASTNYIRGPFIVESIMYGIVSGIISVAIVRTIFSVSAKTFEASSLGLLDIKFSNHYFSDHFWMFIGLQLVAGTLIGAMSSLIATRRYLKFKTSR